MSVKQVSVLVENENGKLAETTRFLAQNGINLRALSIADTENFGILRVIVDEPEEALRVLKEGGYITKLTEVLAVSIEDAPGALSRILTVIAEADVKVEYTYAFLGTRAKGAYMIFRVDNIEKTSQVLAAAGIKTAEQTEMF